ncbi:MAG: hypothetical protein ACERKN_22290 [Velocimicrobium sp.]
MLKEIIQNKKIKAVIIIVIVIFLYIVVYCVIQQKKENNNHISKTDESEEVSAISGGGKTAESEEVSTTYGEWKITEYLGESVEYHGAEATTKTEKIENEKAIKEKYLYKKLYIDSKNITAFSSPTELGYHVLSWDELFSIYRQPSDI